MELELIRVNYTVVGITNSNCLELIGEESSKDPQMIAVGDVDGTLQVFSLRKDGIHLHFKTLPGPPITSVKGSGAAGTSFDKIFIAFGTEVRGYTKKGKQILMFQSGLTEPIKAMYILDNDLFLCGEHIYTHYRDCKELGSYICGDKIVDVIAYYPYNSKRQLSLIACEGRMIRTIEYARVTSSIEIDSSPTLLHIYEDEDHKTVLFGTVDGRIGILDLENTQAFQRWLIVNDEQTSILCVDSYALNGNTAKHLITGSQNGNIDVYQINIQDELNKPKMIFRHNCKEPVMSLKCGIIGAQETDEIVVATYSGRIFGLTQTTDGDTQLQGDSTVAVNNFPQVTKLKTDIEDLKNKIVKARESYHSSTLSIFYEVSTNPLLLVKDSFFLEKNTSCYNLTIDLSTPLDNILLQCNCKIGITEAARNSAAVSYSDCDETDGNTMLVTYRCQINTNGLKLKVHTSEGQKGKIHAYVTPILQPKCCRLLTYDIKPLSLHYRSYQFDEDRPFNVLSLKGPFSLAEIHFWLSQCLPEVPEKSQTSENTPLWFKSSLLGTVIECKYKKGEAEIKSDNVTTISILKTNLTEEATKKRNKLEINTKINDESINFVIKSQEEKVRSIQNNSQKQAFLKGIQELEIDEGCIEMLPRKYITLTKTTNFDNSYESFDLEELYDAITNLYIDYNKLKGINANHKKGKLRQYFEEYDSNQIIGFFQERIQA